MTWLCTVGSAQSEQLQLNRSRRGWSSSMNAAYQFLDLVPKGRDEPAEGDPQFWVRRHDEYGSLSQHHGADPDSW